MSTDITLLSSEGIRFVIFCRLAPNRRHLQLHGISYPPAGRKHHFYVPPIRIGRQGIRVMTSGSGSLVLNLPQKALITIHRMHDSFHLEHSAALTLIVPYHSI